MTGNAEPSADEGELSAPLTASRAALLGALTERTEQDFARPLGGATGEETLGRALAALAAAERADVAATRAATEGSSAAPAVARELPERPLPPQVTHDLAGARHQTLTALGTIEDRDAAARLVSAISERESALAARIVAAMAAP
ncbi:MAG: hypothetical protein O3A76_07510 [Chloroflexi bacterium]|nr:hypothetical protein [Chloroflexota bacterium]